MSKILILHNTKKQLFPEKHAHLNEFTFLYPWIASIGYFTGTIPKVTLL